jgi:hypothetical protein
VKTVYILVNESMPDIIKIGKTENLERRIKELDVTSTPLPFECFYAVELGSEEADSIEKNMHRGLEQFRVRKNREFFNVAPENARDLLKIAETMGGKDVTPTEDILNDVDDKIALQNAHSKRQDFNFDMINMPPDTELEFGKDRAIKCMVVDSKRIRFRDETTSLTRAAQIILAEMGYPDPSVSGPRFWTFKGETLAEIRRQGEN